MYRDTTNVEHEMYDCTSNNWSHWNSNEKIKEKFGSCTGTTFDRFSTKYSYTWNITHNTESTAMWSLKPERWGSPLVQEKYREEKACDRRHTNHIIIHFLQFLRLSFWSIPGYHAGSPSPFDAHNAYILVHSFYFIERFMLDCVQMSAYIFFLAFSCTSLIFSSKPSLYLQLTTFHLKVSFSNF